MKGRLGLWMVVVEWIYHNCRSLVEMIVLGILHKCPPHHHKVQVGLGVAALGVLSEPAVWQVQAGTPNTYTDHIPRLHRKQVALEQEVVEEHLEAYLQSFSQSMVQVVEHS